MPRHLLLTAGCFVLALLVSPRTEARTFQPVGTTNGLDAQVAVSLVFDHDGFLWVGSREGLFRYDGYRALGFQPEPDVEGSISDGDIRVVFVDSEGTVWVGTNTGGLNRYEPSTRRFTAWRADSSDPGALLDDGVYAIAEGPGGGLWVGTQKGLSRLDRATGRFEHFRHDPDRDDSLSANWVYHLRTGPTGTLWAATVGGGLNRWEPSEGRFTRYDFAALTDGPEDLNQVFALIEQEDGRVWAGTKEGLVVLVPSTPGARYFDLGEVEGNRPLVTSMAEDATGRLWLGTMNHRGVIVVDPRDETWEAAGEHATGRSRSAPSQPPMSIAVAQDQVFVGTWGNGVFRTPVREMAFRLLNEEFGEDFLRYNNVTAVMAGAKRDTVWVGSFGGGPQRLDVARGLAEVAWTDDDPLGSTGVIDLETDHTGRVWAGAMNGVFSFAADGGPFEHETAENSDLGQGYVYALLPEADRGLWVGLMGTGLYFRDAASGQYLAHAHDPEDPTSLSGDFVTALAADGPDHLWVGTRSNGLNRCLKKPFRCERFPGRGDGEGELSHFHVTSLYRDRRGRLWVGTDGGGLNRVIQDENGEGVRFEHWDSGDGLLDDGVMAIEEDADESLWLSTRHGLSRFNPRTGQLINYVSESGLPTSHFNVHAAASDEERIYFGSVDGLLSIPKGTLLEERAAAPMRITLVQRAARGERPRRVTPGPGGVEVPWGEILTLEFASLDFSEAGHAYAYRLGEGEPWIDLGPQRQVIFHGLSPGTYAFEARGRDSYGLWGVSEPLRLRIEPPFWMETWFRGLLATLLVLGAWGLHNLRLARQRRSALEIQRLSSKREEALEQALGSEAELSVLTPRQKEVLQLVAEGYSTREIAVLLDVSIKTVEAHRANLMERLDIHDVPGLVRLAIRARLVSPHH